MPRDLDGTLTEALESGNFTAIIRGWLGDDQAMTYEIELLSYKINQVNLEAEFYYDAETLPTEITIERGVRITGQDWTLFSIPFTIKRWERQKKIFKIQGELATDSYYSEAGDVTYQVAIETWMASTSSIGFVPAYLNDVADWLDYQFFPAGKQIIINRLPLFQNLLRQKYFIYITDNGNSSPTLNKNPLVFSIDDVYNRALDHTIRLTHADRFSNYPKFANLFWRDENETITTTGSNNIPQHNLGYLESTADYPECFPFTVGGAAKCVGENLIATVPINLTYRTGDKVKFESPDGSQNFTCVLDVTEIFKAGTDNAWHLELRSLQYISNTEGGALPSTIERVSNYTPINTSYFTATLSETDNNLQAAMDTLDDHDHSALATTEGIQDIIGAMVSGNTETGIAVTYDDTNGKLDFDAQTAGDARYAPIAKGVTNGDTHDHKGGDGDTISHLDLSSIGTFTHSQLDDIHQTGWIPITATWTRTGNYTFTLVGDLTAVYRKGRKVRYKDGGSYEYGIILSSSFSGGNTTVTLITNTDYTMAAVALTDTYISIVENPEGFPGLFNFTPSWTNVSVGNGTVVAQYTVQNNQVKGFITLSYAAASPTTSITGQIKVAPPATAISYGVDYITVGASAMVDFGTALYMGEVIYQGSGSVFEVRCIVASGTYATWAATSGTVPFTFGANDIITIEFNYFM